MCIVFRFARFEFFRVIHDCSPSHREVRCAMFHRSRFVWSFALPLVRYFISLVSSLASLFALFRSFPCRFLLGEPSRKGALDRSFQNFSDPGTLLDAKALSIRDLKLLRFFGAWSELLLFWGYKVLSYNDAFYLSMICRVLIFNEAIRCAL